jgi:MFS family permease
MFRHAASRVRSPSDLSGALRDPGGVANIIVAFHGQAGYWSKRLCAFLSSGIGGSRRRNSLCHSARSNWMTTSEAAASTPRTGEIVSKAEERRVIFASSLGTVFEWYDFYLYAVLAPFFATLFFPSGNPTAALLSAFVTYAAGFLVRPFGAIVFGRIGDLVGRKYTFLITITVMGASTFLVGLLPTFKTIGWAAPTILTLLRLTQGLALGGEYGGAATYVAEHAPTDKRGRATSWIQTTATVGLLLALAVIWICRKTMEKDTFASWGWRIPFILSLVLLVFSVYIRLRLQESPVFRRMKKDLESMDKDIDDAKSSVTTLEASLKERPGEVVTLEAELKAARAQLTQLSMDWNKRGSKRPLRDSFLRYPNNKYVLLALLGATAGQGVVWYTGQFQALFFLQNTLKLDALEVYPLIAASLIIGTPFFLFFGRLSDRVGRLKIILAGCLIAALTYVPLFKGLTHYTNPALETFQEKTQVTVAADEANCEIHIFRGPWTKFSACDNAKDYLTSRGISFDQIPAVAGKPVVVSIGDAQIEGWAGDAKAGSEKAAADTLKAKGYPSAANPDQVNYFMVILILIIMVIYVTMVYGPIAAYLVELFPTKIRYTSMSLPYHIGNGWFGGMLPLLFTALVAASGDIYRGLWYPIIVALITVVVGAIFLRETPKTFDIHA